MGVGGGAAMIVGVAGLGKARGVTTVALGVAMAMVDVVGESVFIEADVAGGDVGYWRDLAVEGHGVLEAAAAMGPAASVEEKLEGLISHGWEAESAPGCSVVPLQASGKLSTQVSTLWAMGQEALERVAGAVVIDFGRWGSAEFMSTMWSGMDAGIVVCDGSLAGLKRAHANARSEPTQASIPTWSVVNGSAWDLAEINRRTNLDFVDVLDWDRKGASAIRLGNAKATRRSVLGRQLANLSREVAEVASNVV